MKIYTITNARERRGVVIKTNLVGTLAELVQSYSYTLLVGHQNDATISTHPKTIVSLVYNVNKSYHVSGVNEYAYIGKN